MSEAFIPVDLYNPGQVFACLGFMEAADILLGGAPRSLAIVNGTLAGAIGLGLRLWIAGLVIWAVGHAISVWAARRDPQFVDVARRHLRYPAWMRP